MNWIAPWSPRRPFWREDGGFVATGYSAELDEMTALRDEARSVIARMQADYAGSVREFHP